MNPQHIKTIRELTGLSQAKLAQELGVHRNTVKNWETGKLKTIKGSVCMVLRSKYGHLFADAWEDDLNLEVHDYE